MKVCDTCNIANNDDAKYCQKCGKDIENISVVPNPINVGGSALTKDYSRLGGWLMFFLVLDIISIFSAASALFSSLSVFMNGGGLKELIILLSVVVPAIPLAVSVAFRYNRDSRFLLWFQVSVIINLLAMIYIYGVTSYVTDLLPAFDSLYSSMGHDIMDFAEQIKFLSIGFSVISAAVRFFLFTLYYCKSKRVNAYMGSDEYKQKALVKF